ncbi:MAG: hypothetical protein O4965_22755, partial [Trichodesmium sp. St19_bin1]|nr:hypothetical protein [Trichodesmium sp. St19_bin1]
IVAKSSGVSIDRALALLQTLTVTIQPDSSDLKSGSISIIKFCRSQEPFDSNSVSSLVLE